MKALIFTDLHVHSHKDRIERLQDCLKTLRWVFKTAKQKGCRHIFFLGDLFHERSKIDVLNYLKTFEVIMEEMKDAEMDMHLLVGNHDMYHKVADKWDINSIKPVSAISNCHVVQKPTTMKIGGRRIDWMPYTENQLKDLDELKENNEGPLEILFGHFAVHGAETNILYGVKSDVMVEYDNDMQKVDADVFSDWNATFLGHYHGAQKLNDKVEYVGSPLQLSFGEAFQRKHVIILDLETMKKEYVVNNFSPKHLIINKQDIEDENYDFDDCFVRCEVDDIGSQELIDTRRHMVKEFKMKSFDFKQKDKKIEEEQAVIEDAKSILSQEGEMLETYVKDTGVPEDLDEDELIKWGKEIISCSEKKT